MSKIDESAVETAPELDRREQGAESGAASEGAAPSEARGHRVYTEPCGTYIASRASLPERSAAWRRLRDVDGWKLTCSWIDEAGVGETADLGALWSRIEAEVAQSERRPPRPPPFTEARPLRGHRGLRCGSSRGAGSNRQRGGLWRVIGARSCSRSLN